MPQDAYKITINLSIMGRNVQMRCAPDEIHALETAAQYLNSKICELHEDITDQIYNTDKTLVTTALNIAKELILLREQHHSLSDGISNRIATMLNKIECETAAYS